MLFDLMLFGTDGTFLLMFLGVMLLAFLAQLWVQGSYKKFLEAPTPDGATGYEIAYRMLQNEGINDVSIEVGSGRLSDYYDPRRKVIRLSNEVYYGSSVSSSAIATHEAGHAVQHAKGYFFLAIRNTLLPMTVLANQLYLLMIILGIIFVSNFLFEAGIWLFAIVALFQLITLPIEFDASSRAYHFIYETQGSEMAARARQVLTPAAMTYVVSLLTTLLYLLRYIAIYGGRRRR